MCFDNGTGTGTTTTTSTFSSAICTSTTIVRTTPPCGVTTSSTTTAETSPSISTTTATIFFGDDTDPTATATTDSSHERLCVDRYHQSRFHPGILRQWRFQPVRTFHAIRIWHATNFRKFCVCMALMSIALVIHLQTTSTTTHRHLVRCPGCRFLALQGRNGSMTSTEVVDHVTGTTIDAITRLPPPFKVVGYNHNESKTLDKDMKGHRLLYHKHKPSSWPFNCTFSKCSRNFTVCVYEQTVDRYISGALLSSGVWEPYITSAFQSALDLHPQANVLDVGANIGYYSLLASAKGHDVIAVEPHEENQKRLQAGVILTTLRHRDSNDTGTVGRVLLLGNAMSDCHRLVGLSRSRDNQGGLRVLEKCQTHQKKGILGLLGSGTYEDKWYTARSGTLLMEADHRLAAVSAESSSNVPCYIPTLTMNDLTTIVSNRTVVIKVDVEGYECRAMGQAGQFLSSNHVPYIFMEWRQMRERQHDLDTTCPTHRIRQLSSALSGLGYVPHEVRSGIRLNPYSAPDWRVGDVYWRRRDHRLLVPSM